MIDTHNSIYNDAICQNKLITRQQYLSLGYDPIPCAGKSPVFNGWQKIRIDVDTVASWEQYSNAENTGIRTRYAPAIDIDVYDAEIAERIKAAVLKLLPPGAPILERIGQAPKVLIPCQCQMPFDKATTGVFEKDGITHKVEVLGDGQQFIARGIHPDTHQPYVWKDLDLSEVARADLPMLDESLAHRIVACAESIMREVGWVEPKAKAHKLNGRTSPWAAAALEGECEKVRSAPEGIRNDTLNVAAFSLGQIISGGELDRNEVEQRLFQAARALVADDGKSSVKATITSGIEAGMKEPRSTPTTTPEHAPVLKTAMLHSAAKIKYVCAADVKQRPVIWIWKGRLAKGKMTILSGDPGLGKSQIANYMIACITKGDSWCDNGVAPQGNCIILSAEDADDDTICPRLEVAGANLRRVQIIKSVMKDGQDHSVSLAHDLSALAEMIQEIGNVVLIVVDPITAYLGDKIDSHQTTAVRAILEPVSQFAEQQNIAILAITHPPKASQSKAMHSFTGSLAFVAAARIALLAVEEQETERKLLLGVKNNLKKLPDGLAYHMRETTTDEGIEACHIIWENTPVDITANEAVRSSREGSGKIKEAEAFLKNYLKDQVVPSQEVLDAASANGIKQPTLYRAKDNLGVISQKAHFDSYWTWRLPT